MRIIISFIDQAIYIYCEACCNRLHCLIIIDLHVYLGCNPGNVRLVGGSSANEGRVEICFNSTWGTVCDNYWDNIDAEVVCQQLGYSFRNAEAFINASFGQGSGFIHLDNVRCTGTELLLLSCNYTSNQNCNHFKDAGVRCNSDSIFGKL